MGYGDETKTKEERPGVFYHVNDVYSQVDRDEEGFKLGCFLQCLSKGLDP